MGKIIISHVNIFEYLETVLAYLKTHPLQNKNVSLKHAFLSTQYFSFDTLSTVQGETANDNSDHRVIQ
jgi:uncharacterized protein YqcC (DUF446 family)